MVKRKQHLLASTLFSLLLLVPTGAAWGGYWGDGPCPVPDLVSDFVSTKHFHQTNDDVRNLLPFEAEKRLLFQTAQGEGRVVEYEPGSCVPPKTASFAVFSKPMTVYPLATLRPRVLPKWFQTAETVFQTPISYTGAVAKSGLFGVRYQLYTMADATKDPSPLCQTPSIAGLKVSRGSQFPYAYFHAIRRGAGGKAVVRLFRQNLQNCKWEEETSFDEVAEVRDTEVLLRFPKQGAVMLTSHAGLLWRENGTRSYFDLNPKDIVQLDIDRPVVLIRNQADDLQLFFPQRPGVSTLLTDAKDFQPGLVGYAPKGSQLFIAGAVQGAGSSGVYEMKLKSPL